MSENDRPASRGRNRSSIQRSALPSGRGTPEASNVPPAVRHRTQQISSERFGQQQQQQRHPVPAMHGLPIVQLAFEPMASSAMTQQPLSAAGTYTSGRPEASRSLYVGKLHLHVNEAILLEIFSTLGAVQEVKIIRDKLTSLSSGYGFVTFYLTRYGLEASVSSPAASDTLARPQSYFTHHAQFITDSPDTAAFASTSGHATVGR